MVVTPEHRFYTHVTAATIVIMLAAIKFAVPLLERYSFVVTFLSSLIAALMSFGVYKALAGFLMNRSRHWKWVKRWLLGASYVNGTWTGEFSTQDGVRVLTVEHFEQELASLVIRGEARLTDGTWYARWESIASAIDQPAGKLYYVYRCTPSNLSESFEGICDFAFQRANSATAPTALIGFSADLPDGKRTRNREHRRSEDLEDFDGVFRAIGVVCPKPGPQQAAPSAAS